VSTAEQVLERIFRLTVVMADAMAEDLAQRGLTRARATLMARLHASGPVTQRVLADDLRVSPRNVTDLVNALEADGFVNRAPHPTDGRAFLVTLTTDGRRAAESLADAQRRLAHFLFAGVRAADRAQFGALLEELLQRLGDPTFDELRRAGLERWPLRVDRSR
jgi:DNA-binding MarR family transcriptional regulator